MQDLVTTTRRRCHTSNMDARPPQGWNADLFEPLKAAGGKAYSNYAVGYNNVDVPSATERGIAVGNTPGDTQPVLEWQPDLCRRTVCAVHCRPGTSCLPCADHLLPHIGVLTETTAELALALTFAAARRVVEGDKFMRAGQYKGWLPNLFVGEPSL